MPTLAQRVTDLTSAVRAKFNAIAPRLMPSGGAAGQSLRKVSAAAYDAAWGADWTYVKLASDFNVTVIAATDSPLGFTPQAGKTYAIQGLLLLRTNNTAAGARPGLRFPSGLDDVIAQVVVGDAAGTAVLMNNTGPSAFSVPVAGLPNITTSWFGRVEGVLVCGPVAAGDCKVTLSTETAGRIATLRAGSYLRYREL